MFSCWDSTVSQAEQSYGHSLFAYIYKKSIKVTLGNKEHKKDRKSESRFPWDSSFDCIVIYMAEYAR